MPKKPFFFKFTGLPYTYSVVMAHNKPLAQAEVAKFRDDGVCFEKDDKVLSFGNYHRQEFQHISVEAIQQFENYKIKSAFSGDERVEKLRKNRILEDLIRIHDYIPGVKNANIFTKGRFQCFGVKSSPQLMKVAAGIMNIEESQLPVEFKQKQALIPICFFSITKEEVGVKEGVKMIEDRNEEQIDFDNEHLAFP